MSELKQKDQFGWDFFDCVPCNFILATMEDFHVKGIKRIGMEFLIRYADKEKYQVCIVSERLTSEFLLPFIEENRVFIKKG